METSTARPPAAEDRYKLAESKTERKRLAAEVLSAYRPRVEALVRSKLREMPEHWPEAEQVGALGLLVALERWNGAAPGVTTFWTHAYFYVRDELRKWLGVGVFWRKDTNRGKSPQRKAARERASAAQFPEVVPDDVRDSAPSPEEAFEDAELKQLARDFLLTLTPAERIEIGTGRHLTEVVTRARSIFLKGAES